LEKHLKEWFMTRLWHLSDAEVTALLVRKQRYRNITAQVRFSDWKLGCHLRTPLAAP
jgi:hypothetical protein